MFQTPEWPSDQEEEVVKKSKKTQSSSSSIPTLVVTQPSDSSLPSSKKRKKKKKKNHDESSGSIDSLQKSDSGSSPTLKRKPSSVSEGDQPDQDEPTSKRKKLKKSMSDAVTSISDAVTESASQVGGLLTRGIRFTSESEFIQFVSGKKKKKKNKSKENSENSLEDGKQEIEVDGVESSSPEKKKKKKRKKSEEGQNENSVEVKKTTEESDTSPAKKKKKKKKDKDATKKTVPEVEKSKNDESSPIKKKKKKKGTGDEKSDESQTEKSKSSGSAAASAKKTPNFDIAKLKAALEDGKEKEVGTTNGTSSSAKSFGNDAAKNRLKSSQFRFLNEKLYTQNGTQSMKMFTNDKEAFRIYHEGYTEQVRKWPKNPLNIIISAIMKVSGNPVVADFGCGEARLARAVSSCCEKVYSFDLVATNELVTACDMSHTPLENGSIDIAVFCLSLMGTNLRDYVKEANRVLKVGGILKIAEVESRFQDFPVEEFTKAIEKCGFKLKWKDLTHKYFYLMDFTKTEECKKKVPEFKLKACVYKKR